MTQLQSLLTSPAMAWALAAAVVWAPIASQATWPALARGRLGSTVLGCVAVSVFVFQVVRCASAPDGR